MQTTALAIENLLCAKGDPLADVERIGPVHGEFHAALILHAAVGVIAKLPSALPAIREALMHTVLELTQDRSFAAMRARKITAPGLAVFAAQAEGRHEDARQMFARPEPLLPEARGSRAQLEIFYDLGQELARPVPARDRDRLGPEQASRAA